MATATKITLPAVKNALINAGFVKAEWRNRSSEKLHNSGFLASHSEIWVKDSETDRVVMQKVIMVDWVMKYSKDSDAPHINSMINQMSEALTAAGIAHTVAEYSWANAIRIIK